MLLEVKIFCLKVPINKFKTSNHLERFATCTVNKKLMFTVY